METKKPAAEITLAEICKGLKMEPRTARRHLRKAEAQVDGARWIWKRGSAEALRITNLLKEKVTK